MRGEKAFPMSREGRFVDVSSYGRLSKMFPNMFYMVGKGSILRVILSHRKAYNHMEVIELDKDAYKEFMVNSGSQRASSLGCIPLL